MDKKPKAPKSSKMTRRERKADTMYKANPTWAAEDGYTGPKKMKTGGMVNPNAKVSAIKTAGSKGVKSGVNSKVTASKVAKGRVGGTSTAPKGATPKAKMGGMMKGKKC